MSFDGLMMRAIVRQLNELLTGGRIDKVSQPTDRDLVLSIRQVGKTHRLLLSAHASFPRVHLIREASLPNPSVPPTFCMLLRKHCEGSRIRAVTQVGMERILWIDVEQFDELGDLKTRRLIVEVMGRHSNISLVDVGSGRILDSIVHVSHAVNRHRELLPGRTYVAPPEQGKRDPMTESAESFMEILLTSNDEPLKDWLVQTFAGIGPDTAREITFRAGEGDDALYAFRAFSDVLQGVQRGTETPSIVWHKDEGPLAFGPMLLKHRVVDGAPEIDLLAEADPSACVERYFADRARRDVVRQKSTDLRKVVERELQKLATKLDNLRGDREEAQEADRCRLYGELLSAYGYQIEPGSTKAKVPNYYDEAMAEIEIPLDPALNASQNAQVFFKRYSKARTRLSLVDEQMRECAADLAYLESVLTQLDLADFSDIEDIREELAAGGFVSRSVQRGTKRSGRDSRDASRELLGRVERFVSSDGTEILVGRNNRQNDFLTMRCARKSDTWLHTKDIPGSHVVLRTDSPSEEALREAATLAAWFSKGRTSSSVPVDYTLVRHIWKPNGARPGFVLYDHQRTLYVTPHRERVESLQRKEEGAAGRT